MHRGLDGDSEHRRDSCDAPPAQAARRAVKEARVYLNGKRVRGKRLTVRRRYRTCAPRRR